MNINDLIKNTMKELMGVSDDSIKEKIKVKLNTLKMIKTSFMEYVTKKENASKFDEADDVSIKITKIPEDIQQGILYDLAKEHNKNIEGYKNAGNEEMMNAEMAELEVINGFLPKETTKEDVLTYLHEYYPSGIEKKSIGIVIREVKSAFDRVDGAMVAECVKTILV